MRFIILFLWPVLLAAGEYDAKGEARLNRGYYLEYKEMPAKKATYTLTVKTSGYSANQWNVFFSKPPSYEFQKNVKTEFNYQPKTQKDKNDDSRSLYRLELTGDNIKSSFHVKATYRFTPVARKLTKKRPRKDHKTKPLTKEEISRYLKATKTVNHDSKEFRSWLKATGLIRKKKEGQIEFARRAFQHIANNFTYLYTYKMNRECNNVRIQKKSDCGGLSILLISTLRANGIPARLICGRWAKSAEKGKRIGEVAYFQQHVKCEFYAEGVGWVPNDMSAGVSAKRNKEFFFGMDRGIFFTAHFDCDFKYDTKLFGVKEGVFLQSCYFWTRGSGKYKKESSVMDWKVTVTK